MWSRRRAAACGLAALLSLALPGCGFQPVYGDRPDGGGAAALHQVSVEPIPDRVGVRLRSELNQLFSPQRAPATHSLRITIESKSQVMAIAEDASVRRRNLQLRADVRLFQAGSDGAKPDFSTVVRANAGSDQLPSDFSTLVSEQAAEQRAVELLARRIRQQLAIYFNQRS